uniref:Uncharacterized protein n=1 Tax=Ditylenchus dipsaci TaxID=166011 RepID=A0A915EEY0_9BILA
MHYTFFGKHGKKVTNRRRTLCCGRTPTRLARLQDLDGINEEAEMFEYMHVDDDVITDGALSLEEIVEECSKNADSQDSVNESIDIDEEEADPVEPPVKCMEAARAMDTVRRFVEKNFADHNILKHSDALDDAIYQFRTKNLIQKKLTNFSL